MSLPDRDGGRLFFGIVVRRDSLGERARIRNAYSAVVVVGTLVSSGLIYIMTIVQSLWLLPVAICVQASSAALGWVLARRCLGRLLRGDNGDVTGHAVPTTSSVLLFPIIVLMFSQIPVLILSANIIYGVILDRVVAAGASGLHTSYAWEGAGLFAVIGLLLTWVLDAVTPGRSFEEAFRDNPDVDGRFLHVTVVFLLCLPASFGAALLPAAGPGGRSWITLALWTILALRLATSISGAWLLVLWVRAVPLRSDDDSRLKFWRAGVVYVNRDEEAGRIKVGGFWGGSPNLAKRVGWVYLFAEAIVLGSFTLLAMGGVGESLGRP